MAHLSHPYMITGETIALTIQTFVSKVMSLLFNMLPRFAQLFSREKASFNFMAAVILETKKRKSVAVSIVSPSIYHEVMEPDTMILVF